MTTPATATHIMIYLLIFFLSLDVTLTPQPESVSPLKRHTLWTVYACSDEAVRVPGVRIEAAAAKHVRLIPRALAADLMARRRAETWQSRVLRIGGLAVAGTTMVTGAGLVTASAKTVSALALATATAPEIGASLRASIPSFEGARLLGPEPVEIQAGGCATALILSPRARSAKSVSFVVPLPASEPAVNNGSFSETAEFGLRGARWGAIFHDPDPEVALVVGDPMPGMLTETQLRLIRFRLNRVPPISAIPTMDTSGVRWFESSYLAPGMVRR